MESVDKKFVIIYVQSSKPIVVWKTKIPMKELNGFEAGNSAIEFNDECGQILLVTLPFSTPVVDVWEIIHFTKSYECNQRNHQKNHCKKKRLKDFY